MQLPRLSLQGVFWALPSAAGFRAIALHHLFAFKQRWVQVPALRLPPKSLPIVNLSLEEAALPTAWSSCRQAPLEGSAQSAPIPGACPQPKGLPLVPASPSQLCEPSLGIWFVSSWQCHPPKCHGMQKSMKTRDPRHVFLFVCMCQHFQWLRNVCL